MLNGKDALAKIVLKRIPYSIETNRTKW